MAFKYTEEQLNKLDKGKRFIIARIADSQLL